MKNIIIILMILILSGCSGGGSSSYSEAVPKDYIDSGDTIIYYEKPGHQLREIHFTGDENTEYCTVYIATPTANSMTVYFKDVNRYYDVSGGIQTVTVKPAQTGNINLKRQTGYYIRVVIDGIEIYNVDLGSL